MVFYLRTMKAPVHMVRYLAMRGALVPSVSQTLSRRVANYSWLPKKLGAELPQSVLSPQVDELAA